MNPVPRSSFEGLPVTYVVNDDGIRCKDMDCVEVCPVDRFYEGENMLVIHSDECIDCGRCAPERPADAIASGNEPGVQKWLMLNARYPQEWPNITKRHPSEDRLLAVIASRARSGGKRG